MGSGGHNAKPAGVLKLHGQYRDDRHGNRGPAEGGAVLQCPDNLGRHGRAMWRLVATQRKAWLAKSDAPALRRLCDLWELAEKLRESLLKHPADKDLRCSYTAYHAEWCRLAARFGLTPSDRARLGENVEERRKGDEIEDMLA